jgi:four helix bundle protein
MEDDRQIRRFEELRVWITARGLCRGIYRAAKSQPLSHDFAMLGQMKRAAISISSNIAEGFERGTRRQQIEACYIAKGSAGELRSQVILAHDVGLLDQHAFEWLHAACESCSRQLAAYIRHLKQSRERIPGAKFVSVEREAGPTEATLHAAPLPTSPHPHLPTEEPPNHEPV